VGGCARGSRDRPPYARASGTSSS